MVVLPGFNNFNPIFVNIGILAIFNRFTWSLQSGPAFYREVFYQPIKGN